MLTVRFRPWLSFHVLTELDLCCFTWCLFMTAAIMVRFLFLIVLLALVKIVRFFVVNQSTLTELQTLRVLTRLDIIFWMIFTWSTRRGQSNICSLQLVWLLVEQWLSERWGSICLELSRTQLACFSSTWAIARVSTNLDTYSSFQI